VSAAGTNVIKYSMALIYIVSQKVDYTFVFTIISLLHLERISGRSLNLQLTPVFKSVVAVPCAQDAFSSRPTALHSC